MTEFPAGLRPKHLLVEGHNAGTAADQGAPKGFANRDSLFDVDLGVGTDGLLEGPGGTPSADEEAGEGEAIAIGCQGGVKFVDASGCRPALPF